MKRRGQKDQKRKTTGRTAAARPSRRSAKPLKAPAVSLQIELQDHTRELNEAREQLAATTEVLSVISSSPGDLAPAFDSMLANAARLCKANFGALLLLEGYVLRIAAVHLPAGANSAAFERGTAFPLRENPDVPLDRLVVTKGVVHIADLRADPSYIGRNPRVVSLVETAGTRAFLAVPLLKDDEVIGAFALNRQEARPFTDKQIDLVKNFAAQAVIAIENARLLGELRELLERQTATSEVLGVISRSKFELQPVLQSVVDTAERLCRAEQTVIFRLEDGVYRFAAGHGTNPAYLDIERQTVISPGPGTAVGRAAMTRKVARIDDAWNDPLYEKKSDARVGGARSMIGVPLMRDGEPIGVIALARNRVDPFNDREIELVATFADQAVIAIENVRLFEAEQQRTNELTESLEQQTATAKVLQVISRSTFDLQKVLSTLVESAARLCLADRAALFLREGDAYRMATTYGFSPGAGNSLAPLRIDRTSITGRVGLAGKAVHVHDVLADPEYRASDYQQAFGYRTNLGVPLLRDGTTVGVFALVRSKVDPFTDKQIEVVTTFADQAVIAIENARLLSELREALEQQTATADVLKVISRSTFDLQTVFETLVDSAARLCRAHKALICRLQDESFQVVAAHGFAEDYLQYVRSIRWGIDRHSTVGRAALEAGIVHIHDVLADPDHKFAEAAKLGGFRTVLGVPIMRQGVPIGALFLARPSIDPFTQSQTELVSTFADQAAIAIENTRLLSELRELLEQQTATSEVLEVISSSPGDLAPVFEAMLANAVRICDAKFGTLFLHDNETFNAVAAFGAPPALAEFHSQRGWFKPAAGTGLDTVLRTRDVARIADEAAEETPSIAARLGGARSLIVVPMLKEDTLAGAITIYRQEVRPFTEKQIALVASFASQAVIAIENARLLNELRESLEQQTATANVLTVISGSPGDLGPVFDAMLESATRLCEANFGTLLLRDGEILRIVARHVPPESSAFFELGSQLVVADNKGHPIVRVLETKDVLHIADLRADPSYTAGNPRVLAFVETVGTRTALCVPMMKDDECVGVFVTSRPEVRPFTDKQIELVKNFAAQAVIAIENARLLSELRESLEQQTATADVLRVISSSPGDLAPVFTSILDNATRICQARFGTLFLREGEALRVAAHHGSLTKAWDEQWRVGLLLQPDSELQAFQTLLSGRPLQVVDLSKAPSYLDRNPKAVNSVEVGGIRTMLTVPMVKDGETIGVITIFRTEIREFTDKQIALVTNFAAQAVIAIENARLLSELRARTDELARSVEELRALGETSQAVNSTLDLEAVLNTIVTKAVQLSATEAGAIYVFDTGREFRLRATYGMDQALIAALGEAHIRMDEQNIAMMLANREPLQTADLSEAVRSPVDDIVLRSGFRARLAAPLFSGDDIVGLLVARRRTPGAFAPNTVDLMKTFAAQSALAIQNARLFQEIDDKGRQLEVASRHKSQFLANMSHELRTPLNAILGYTELILDNIYGEAPDKMRAVLVRVQTNGKHLLGLINDVLDLSKIEAGQLTLSLNDYSLAELVQGVYVAVEPLASQKKSCADYQDRKRPAGRTRRRAPPGAGAAQPRRQRHQVHRDGRSGDQGLASGQRVPCRGARFRAGHRRHRPAENLRGVPAGRQYLDAAERRHRLGAGHIQAHRRDAWRPHSGSIPKSARARPSPSSCR